LPQVFPVSGGLAKNLGLNEEALVIDGADTCLDSLKTLPTQREKPKFLDILFCRGCIDGPEIDSPLDPYTRMQIVRNYARTRTPETLRIPQGVNLQRSFAPQPIPVLEPSKNEIRDILKFTFKLSEEDELNCGACGYNTCQEKAVAVYQGLAEIDMCLPYLLHKSRGEVEYYKERLQSLTGRRQSIQSLIGETQRMLEVKKVADRAATGDIHLVVQGESGSGKRMLAQAIHQSSSRRNKPVFEVNCAGLPELMLDADLFGYEEGAFPEGAKGGKPGKLEMAKGGTLILSQVEGLPLSLQAKLIRALQTKEIERIGSSKPVRIDVRIIAVCTVELKKMVAIGKFRADLYYRLNVLSIFLPPLRERAEDIPLLAGYFLDRIILDKSLPPKIFSDEVVKALKSYGWPGNVRELSTTIERAAFISDDPVIRAEHLPHALQRLSKPTLEGVRPLKGAVAELEKELISKALQSTNNNRLAAAQLLGIPRATLYLKLKEYDIND
ncbi:MAG TPA: sigma 54-interacting transcriptional regulator, partial [Verrucomicrobiae bacterium]|nr:sigma 54-interacting transcriptional regulator [Verrucomicrobiae bacterium]